MLAFVALCAIAALGWLDVRDKANISKILATQEELLTFRQRLSDIEGDLLSARINEISLITTRKFKALEDFEETIERVQESSAELVEDIGDHDNLPSEFTDDLKITLAEDLEQYANSVETLAEVEMRIGLQEGQGLLLEIEMVRQQMIRLMASLEQDSLLLAFSNIQLTEQEFSKTLNMQISAQLVENISRFQSEIKEADLTPEIKDSLFKFLNEYSSLVGRLLESTLELELAIAASTLHFERVAPKLKDQQVSLDRTLNLVEGNLVRQRRVATLQTALLFGSTFLIILVFVILQIKNNQQLILRLEKLASHMDKVGLGYYPNPYDLPEGKDEVGILSKAFLSMTSQIHEQIEMIEEERKKAEVANNAKSAFLANMSHELRTPLNVILGFTQIIYNDPSIDPEYRRYLSIINNSGEHLLSLINDVLEISKIESGKFTLKLVEFDLDKLLDMLQKLFQVKAELKQLNFTVTRSPEVPQYIRADEAKLRQILINLLGNALKFTETGRVSLTILLDPGANISDIPHQPLPPQLHAHAATESSSDTFSETAFSEIATYRESDSTLHSWVQLRFLVEDTGPGIASEEFETLFESFSQASVGQKFQEGTGLGLAISRQFARFMGGDLTVDSILGKGSVFTLILQAESMVGDREEIAERLGQLTKRIQKLAPRQDKPRILVAEDRAGNRLLMRKLLEGTGFEVEEAIDGQKAVECWKNWHPDLILMDIQMPVMDGLEATQKIRGLNPLHPPKIIALTASAFEEQRQAILDAGCDDFASKPVNRERLLTLIGYHLDLCYLYADSTPPKSEKPRSSQSLSSQNLQFMPSTWIKQLYQAAIRGDDNDVHNLIRQIPQEQQELITTLTAWTNDYRFDLLLELVEPIQS
ncbi:MAG: response regulator [Leptolyngbya sp. SIO1D8]|nr:response regulator [Leptolyngbya sp. SIO1D8]